MDELNFSLRNEIVSACRMVNERRDYTIGNSVIFEGNIFDSDATSVRRVTGAAILAGHALAAGEPFEIDWITKDNSVVKLSAADVVALGKAFADQETMLVMKANGLKERIRACTSIEEVWSIRWENA